MKIYKNTRKVTIQGGKTAIYKWLEHHQEIFACLNGKSKVDEKEAEEKNESNVQEMHSVSEQSQTILQTVSNYIIAQDIVAQEHPATPDLSPKKQSTFQDLKMLVSNIESSLASCQKHFQSEIGKINQRQSKEGSKPQIMHKDTCNYKAYNHKLYLYTQLEHL